MKMSSNNNNHTIKHNNNHVNVHQSACQISVWCFSAVESMFSAMCECQALHPDPEDDDSDSDFEGEEYDLEEAGEEEHAHILKTVTHTDCVSFSLLSDFLLKLNLLFELGIFLFNIPM